MGATIATSATSSSAETPISRSGLAARVTVSPRSARKGYDGYPATFVDYLASLGDRDGDHRRFHGRKQPAYIHHNAYANGATPYEFEKDAVILGDVVSFSVVEEGEEVHLEIDLPEGAPAALFGPVTSNDLPPVRFVGADFEEPVGTPVVLDTDLLGDRKEHGTAYPPGPLATLPGGTARIRVW